MAFRDSWHRALVYFGLAEDRDVYEEVGSAEADLDPDDRQRERQPVRRLPSSRRRRDEFDDIFADDEAPARTT
ncbi:MAG: cell division inhibitor SepF, partial [Solirubrobacteraceae bacterium]|nr:cell division inhibitor SepF [Solirubrobacteraceae bacterium]